jgi:hypothetical protein
MDFWRNGTFALVFETVRFFRGFQLFESGDMAAESIFLSFFQQLFSFAPRRYAAAIIKAFIFHRIPPLICCLIASLMIFWQTTMMFL